MKNNIWGQNLMPSLKDAAGFMQICTFFSNIMTYFKSNTLHDLSNISQPFQFCKFQ